MENIIVTPPYESHIIQAMRGKGLRKTYAVRDLLVEQGTDFKKKTSAIRYRLNKMRDVGLVRRIKTDGGLYEWILEIKAYDTDG